MINHKYIYTDNFLRYRGDVGNCTVDCSSSSFPGEYVVRIQENSSDSCHQLGMLNCDIFSAHEGLFTRINKVKASGSG